MVLIKNTQGNTSHVHTSEAEQAQTGGGISWSNSDHGREDDKMNPSPPLEGIGESGGRAVKASKSTNDPGESAREKAIKSTVSIPPALEHVLCSKSRES